MKSIRLTLLFLICLTVSKAQENDVGNWTTLNLQTTFSERAGFVTDINVRNYYLFNDLEQFLARTTFIYQVIPGQMSLGAGATFVHNEAYVKGSENKRIFEERRLHQQWIFRQQTGHLIMSHRYRFEQRFFSDRTRLRMRYQLALQYLLNGKELRKGTWYAGFNNEIMLHTTTPLFDRHRISIGGGYALSPSLRIDLLMMWQILENSRRPQTWLTIYKTIDFSGGN